MRAVQSAQKGPGLRCRSISSACLMSGSRAPRSHQALVAHMEGDEAFVDQQLVELPALVVERAAMLAGHADLEAAAARYLAADVDGAVRDRLRIARGDDAATLRRERGLRGHVLHQ